jgi:hypothetical protein
MKDSDKKNLKKTKSDNELLNDIEEIRRGNNANWMDIVRIAITHDPATTKMVLRKIIEADSKIKNSMRELIK